MHRIPLALALVALLAGLAACAPSGNGKTVADQDVNQANFYADIQAMKSRQQEMRRRLEDLESRLGGPGQGASLDDLNQRMARLEDAVSRIAATLSIDVGLRTPAAASQATSQPALPAYPGAPQAYPEGPQAYPGGPQDYSEAPQGYSPEAQPAGPITMGPSSNDPAESIYNMGMEAYNAHNFDRAMSLFAEMLKTYPTHRLAPNALFWQAEANFQAGDFARTALLCDDLVKKYPNNPLVPSAMLKQAAAFKRLGKPQPAKILLQDVAKRYPGSPEARSAQAQLKDMR